MTIQIPLLNEALHSVTFLLHPSYQHTRKDMDIQLKHKWPTGVNYQCQVTNARLHEMVTSSTMYTLVDNIGTNEFRIYKRLINRTILSGDTVEMSYVAGAGSGLRPFTIDDCRRTTSTGTRFFLRDDPGGIIQETIPRPGETLPSVADSVTFNVRCLLFNVTQPIPSEATIIVQGMG